MGLVRLIPEEGTRSLALLTELAAAHALDTRPSHGTIDQSGRGPSSAAIRPGPARRRAELRNEGPEKDHTTHEQRERPVQGTFVARSLQFRFNV